MRRLLLLLPLLVPAAARAQTTQPAPLPTLTLEQAVKTARARHPDLRSANALTEEARARIDEQRSALFPQLSGNAAYRHTERESSGTVVGSGTTTTGSGTGSDLFSASVAVNQLVWDFGQTTGRVHAAEYTADAQDATGQTTLRTVLLNVRTFYFAARADKALVQVAKETLDNQNRHLEQVQAFIQVGTHPEIDLAQQKTAVANARLQLIKAENSYATARAQLNQAMGTPGSSSFDVAEDSMAAIEGEDGTLDQALEAAYRARPELRSFAAQRKAEEETISSTKGGFWPTLSLSGSASEAGADLNNLGWSVVGSVNLTWNFFQGGLTKAQVREAEWGEIAIDAQTDSLRQSVRVDVENGLLAIRGAKSEITAAEEALLNAREQLRLAEGRYQTGVGSIIELGDAQVALTTAAAQRVQADFDLATARAQLLHALGRDSA